jgi:hypothetical protein
MFYDSVLILMNRKSGELVLDNDLIGSRSSNVKMKTLSPKKLVKRDQWWML